MDHCPNMGFYGSHNNQSECRILQCYVIMFNIVDNQEQRCPNNIVSSCFQQPETNHNFRMFYSHIQLKRYVNWGASASCHAAVAYMDVQQL